MTRFYSLLACSRRATHRLARPLAALGLLLATAGAAQAQTFAPVVTYATGTVPQDIVSVDVNGDGRLDLITANSTTNNVGVLLGSATTPGTFPATATFYGSGGSFPVGLGVGDVNGDGRPDIVVDNASSDNVSVLLGSATTPCTFLAAVSYGSGTSTPRGLGLVDLNGDGRLDIVTGGNTSNTIGVLLNLAATPGTFGPAATYASGVGADGIAVGDVNGDGRPDVAVTGYFTANTITVLLNSATSPGTFPALVAYNSGGVKPRGVTLADVNGDGLADIVAGNETSNTVGVLLNQPATPGTFGTAAMYASGASGPDGVRVRDMNGDGRPDIVASNYNVSNGTTVSVLLNSATTLGTFATGTTYSSGGQGPVGLALGDLNSDGRPDIAATNVLSATVGVLLNTTLFNNPSLTSISPVSGLAGTSVTLTGTNLTGATAVSFNGTAATTFAVVNATTVTATVPTGATTGLVTVTTPVATSNGVTFTVTYPDLVISTPGQSVAGGTYNSITVTGTGTGTLAGDVVVNGALLVQSGGALSDGCNLITGPGTFTLAAGGTLSICRPRGILAVGDPQGNIGLVRVTGGRSFSSDASYIYTGSDATGSGLPSQVRNLSITVPGNVALSAPTSVTQTLTLSSTANLVLGGNALTLLSSASGTAVVVNSSTGVVNGTATVQRYIDPSLNAGPGYRHFSSPVANTTVGDLATTGFSPTLTSTYNSSATPGTTTPFPTVFGYDQSRVTLANAYAPFDRGYLVPAATTTPLAVGQGYAVNIAGTELVDFTGTLNNGPLTQPLSRVAGNTDAGWQLLGNPYPAPLDYSLVAAGDRINLDGAIYVYGSTSQYVGNYRSYVNGVGGNPVLPVGQGFFARVSAGQTSGTLTFRNSQRLTAPNATAFQRTATDTRPLVQLELRGNTGPADALYAYAQTGATPAFDSQFDAEKLTNPTGLNLSSTATSGQRLAIDGRPVFDATTVLPLAVGVPAAGSYTFAAIVLNNLPAGLDAYLRDAQTGQTVNLRTQPSYAFSVTASQASALLVGRFTLQFAASALATASALTAAQVELYPNPAHARFTVLMPGVSGASAVQAELVNALGQVVGRQSAALPASGTALTVETGELAAGVYVLRLRAGAATLAKRVVIQ